MKKSLKKLKLKKDVVTTFTTEKVLGGYGPTDIMCNSTPVWDGGVGCHMK